MPQLLNGPFDGTIVKETDADEIAVPLRGKGALKGGQAAEAEPETFKPRHVYRRDEVGDMFIYVGIDRGDGPKLPKLP